LSPILPLHCVMEKLLSKNTKKTKYLFEVYNDFLVLLTIFNSKNQLAFTKYQ
jgi:hypothetical protein